MKWWGLRDMDCYTPINKRQYLALSRQGTIPKVLTCMCVFSVKPDKDGNPHRAKSRIVVLDNFEDRIYSKADKYVSVLKYSYLCLLTAQACASKRILQQGD